MLYWCLGVCGASVELGSLPSHEVATPSEPFACFHMAVVCAFVLWGDLWVVLRAGYTKCVDLSGRMAHAYLILIT